MCLRPRASSCSLLSPAGLVSAASTVTPKKSAAVTHFKGPGPSQLRYTDGAEDAAAFGAEAGATRVEAGVDAAAVGTDLAFLPAAFLAAFSAFLAAFLLGPADAGASSWG